MRKLAPIFVFTTIATLTAGAAVAAMGDTTYKTTTDKATTSPTVEANTSNPQGLSYGDKSNTATGTNAKMDDKGLAMDHEATAPTRKMKHHKAKIAKAGDPDLMNRAPADSTSGATVNSTTGMSGGR